MPPLPEILAEVEGGAYLRGGYFDHGPQNDFKVGGFALRKLHFDVLGSQNFRLRRLFPLEIATNRF